MFNDQDILKKIYKLINLDESKYIEFDNYYNESNVLFLHKIIELKAKIKQNIFGDIYFNNEKIFDVCQKYNINRFQLRSVCNEVINMDLYLALNKCIISLDDPIYEHDEFNEIVMDSLGICFEPIRIPLYKKYNLVERTKDNKIYILPKETLRIDDQKTKTLLIDVEEENFDVEGTVESLFDNNDLIIINDIIKIKEYAENSNIYIHPKNYKKVFVYIRDNAYMIGEKTYVNKSYAMTTREWSLAMANIDLNNISGDINYVLLSSIKDKKRD